MGAPFRLLRHGADLRLSVTGEDVPSLCARGALALSSLVSDRRFVRPREERSLPVPPGDAGEAVHAFLRSVLLLLVSERFLVRSAEARRAPGRAGAPERWTVTLRGEGADPRRHRFLREVKGVTRHAWAVSSLPGGGVGARFVVDV